MNGLRGFCNCRGTPAEKVNRKVIDKKALLKFSYLGIEPGLQLARIMHTQIEKEKEKIIKGNTGVEDTDLLSIDGKLLFSTLIHFRF